MHITNYPSVILAMLNPLNAFYFFASDFLRAFIAMGSVVLAVTGAEALYADMGHFGRRPIKVSWLYFVLPALLLNYMGQGAMILSAAPHEALAKVKDPFFYLAPDMLRLPLVLLATAATIIASQAVISGAFSVTQQAIQLGFVPRLRITHTSETAAGQIYIPVINWALMIMVILLVLTFRSSSNLAAAYGIAVTGAMLIDTVLIAVVLRQMWKWNRWLVGVLLVLFFFVDFSYLSANLIKIPGGGWFPLLVGAIAFTFLTTWAKGRKLMIDRMNEASLPMEIFIKSAARARRGCRDRGVHDELGERSAARLAPQPQAQQGPARARHPAHRQDRGRALCPGRKTARNQRLRHRLLSGHAALRIHGGNRRSRGARAAQGHAARSAR